MADDNKGTIIAVVGAASLVGLAVVMSQMGQPGGTTRVSKKGGDKLVYKPTILSKATADQEAIIWCQMGVRTYLGMWQSLVGSEGQVRATFPAGKQTTLQIPVIVPTGAPIQQYDVRCEIRDTDGHEVSRKDFDAQVEITG